MTFDMLIIHDIDGVRFVTINRPQALNALNSVVISELRTAISSASVNDDIRAIVLIGAGIKAFVAGADLVEMADMTPRHAEAFSLAVKALVNDIRFCMKPVIAAINGYCFGGGLELALACDIRMASQRASFALPEIKLGILPGGGGIIHLGRLIGHGPARALILTGEPISADRAYELGLISHLVAPSELEGAALDLAAQMGSYGRTAFIQAKQVLNAVAETAFSGGDFLEAKAFGMCFDAPDAHQRIHSFLNRKPTP